MAVVGVIPAAGFATRLQPLQGSKELLSVRGRPVLEFLLERLRAAPCDEIRIVTRRAKDDLAAYAAEVGLAVVYAEPPSVTASLLAGVAGLEEDDVVCFGFPDTFWEPVDGFARLVAALSGEPRLALGLFRGAELERCDVVALGADGDVLGVQVKPNAPRSPWIWGCGAMDAALAREIDRPEPGVFFDRLARERPGSVAGVKLGDTFVDIGTPEALAAVRSAAEEPSG